jgi:hypothetical protein
MSKEVLNNIEKSGFKRFFSDALIIAAFPIVIYLIKFLYDLGQSHYYEIPDSLNSYSVSSLVGSMLVVGLGLVAGIAQMGTILRAKRERTSVEVIVIENTGLIFLAAITLNFYKNDLFALQWVLVAIGVIEILRYFIYPLIRYRKVEGYENKFNAHVVKMNKRRETLTDFIFQFNLFRSSTIFIFIIFVGVITYCYGYNQSYNQTTYYTDIRSKEWIVVRFLDDKVIEQKVDSSNKIQGEFRVRSLIDNGITLRKSNTGKLIKE